MGERGSLSDPHFAFHFDCVLPIRRFRKEAILPILKYQAPFDLFTRI